MKNGANQILKSSFKLSFLFLLFFLYTANIFGQDSGEQERDSVQTDSVKTGFALGKLLLNNPDSIVSKYIYDPHLDRYIYNESVGDFNIGYPIILTPDQYFKLIEKEGINIMSTHFVWHQAQVPTISTRVPRAAFTQVTGRLRKEMKTIPKHEGDRVYPYTQIESGVFQVKPYLS